MLLVNAICSVTVYYVAEKLLFRHLYFSMAKLIYFVLQRMILLMVCLVGCNRYNF